MELEIPSELIRELQTQLRKDAGIPSYDPDDPNLPALPSLSESIAQLDPSPPYLRCKRCSAKLLRGLQSLVCVYCGESPKKEVPPDPISFKSTTGYRWLLQSLGLNGSEIVGPSEETELNRGQSAPSREELTVSELLDFEIQWLAKEEQNSSSQGSPQDRSSVNLTGVDVEDFFAPSQRNIAFTAPEEQLEANTQTNRTESSVVGIPEMPNLFPEAEPTLKKVNMSSNDKDSGWKADFQFVSSSATMHKNSKSSESFVGSTGDISAHIDTVFGLGSDKKGGDLKDDSLPTASVSSDWNQDDIWNRFESVSSLADQAKEAKPSSDGQVGNVSNQSSSLGLFENSNWQSSTRDVLDSKADLDDFESDEWNAFASSSAQDPSDSSAQTEQTASAAGGLPTNNLRESDDFESDDWNAFASSSAQDPSGSSAQTEQTADRGLTNNLRESESTNSPSDIFAESEHFASPNNLEPKITVSYSVNDVKDEAKDSSKAKSKSKSADVEDIMSQMHDLSFMLGSSLTVPSKPDEFVSHFPS